MHAHPDDEASKGAATMARYGSEGVRTVLVTCTGGEAGDILNPAMDRPEVREHLGDVRRAELDASVKASSWLCFRPAMTASVNTVDGSAVLGAMGHSWFRGVAVLEV